MTQPVELEIRARWVVPVSPTPTQVLSHASVWIDQGEIMAVGDRQAQSGRFEPERVVELDQHVLLPGLVNAHTHSPMSLLRGVGDDMPLMPWLQQKIWPLEAAFVDPTFVADGTELAVAEMIRGGTTCCNDMYFYPDVVARTCQDIGFRCAVGMIVIEFPSRWASDTDEYFRRGMEVHDELKQLPLASATLAPHAPYTVSDESLRRVATLSDQLDLPVNIHLHETAHEVAESEQQHGLRPFARLQRLGLVNEHLLAIHMTQLTDHEIETCAHSGVSVMHCPESNLKLASGFCPVERLRRAGVKLALGTDGAPANNDLDMLGEIRTAALLAKGVAEDAEALPAWAALEMATINGARALGLGQVVGSIEAGKRADLTAIRLDALETMPNYEVISQVVYATGRQQVSDVWIDGRRVLDQRRLTRIDIDDLGERVKSWEHRIAQHDG
ncbi:MAG: TRZ/ATZ family hydrolase [Xanthomonadales bacterium]|nr:TRZ/ATZ family hydrolase [Xanthomonadales bacterium]